MSIKIFIYLKLYDRLRLIHQTVMKTQTSITYFHKIPQLMIMFFLVMSMAETYLEFDH